MSLMGKGITLEFRQWWVNGTGKEGPLAGWWPPDLARLAALVHPALADATPRACRQAPPVQLRANV